VKFHPTIRQETIQIQGNWNNQNNLRHLNGQYTTMSSNLASLVTQGNFFRFYIQPPPMMKPGDTIPNVTLEVTGYKNLAWNPLQAQSMYLRIYPNGGLVPTVIHEIPFPVGASNAATYHAVIPELIPLKGHWSYSDLTNSLWELRVIGLHQPSQHYHIDHFNMTGGMMMSPYRTETVLEWQGIPSGYGMHTFEMRYRVTDQRTAGEAFLVQMLNSATQDWLTLTSMTYADGDWVDVAIDAGDIAVAAASWLKPQFRIVDTQDDDYFSPEDQDLFEVEFIRIRSHLQG
jgi:hypothetical protein